MISSFKNKLTINIWNRQKVKHFPSDLFKIARRKLGFIDDAVSLDDLRIPPGNRLEALTGHRTGQYSIRINDQWRICFIWTNGSAFEVEIVDYH
ncbi:type II toxin-antitoxin system RelE/ParE family toxin [Spirochaeta isovalerica]|uniref:type II toxin-antitoxin system RelE/ParE family toxin n=1 Tax=Spirochaeta isovalerica TaxID=150 RepID=UPI00161EFC08|nr:type II toxin-antitoxin system RelE/ParE family toxin [Spirochaeta isovalerica]